MKKIISLFFIFSLLITLFGCDLSMPGKEAAPEASVGENGGHDCSVSGHIGTGIGHDDTCTICGCSLGYIDEDFDLRCDECGQSSCGVFHQDVHIIDNGICSLCGEFIEGYEHFCTDNDADSNCDSCGSFVENVSDTEEPTDAEGTETSEENVESEEQEEISNTVALAAAPVISLNGGEDVVLTIEAVDGADYYQIYFNENIICKTHETTFKLNSHINIVGANEVYVTAVNNAGESEASNSLTVGKLATPEFSIEHENNQNLLSFPWGDVENAEGYRIYKDDGSFLTTIPLGGTFDFNTVYTADGTYLPTIKAYADGWISSEEVFVWVFIGDGSSGEASGGGGGYGCVTNHFDPTVSLDGKTLTIISNNTNMDDNSPDFGNFDIYVDDIFVGGTSATNTGSTFDLTKHLFFNNHTIKITSSCQFHGTSEIIINYTAAVPPVLSFNAPGVNIFMFDGEYQLSISPRSSSDGIIYPQGFDIYVNDAYVLSTQASENGRVLSAAALGIETGVEYTFTVVDTADASLSTTITGTLSK